MERDSKNEFPILRNSYSADILYKVKNEKSLETLKPLRLNCENEVKQRNGYKQAREAIKWRLLTQNDRGVM